MSQNVSLCVGRIRSMWAWEAEGVTAPIREWIELKLNHDGRRSGHDGPGLEIRTHVLWVDT